MNFAETAASHFRLDGPAVSCEKYGCGHINGTYLVITDKGTKYILQRVNGTVFRNIPGLMRNVRLVTDHIARKISDPRGVLRLVLTDNGADTYCDAQGEIWRVFDFVTDSLCLQAPETPEDFYRSAIAFGTFQQQLADFPAETLAETIPNFHNTPDRYRKLHGSIERDVRSRAAGAKYEIDEYLSREEMGGELMRRLSAGILPLKVTHNDTKLNNVMFDAATREPLCVIDLDTVMPGLVAFDFGDSIRFGAATAAEDETDLSKMTVDLDLYRTFLRGFLTACPDLTDAEIESLPLGAKIITLENGVRFLTDYLDGDVYFAIDRPDHNLLRTRTQLRLVQEMERKWDEMLRITAEEKARARGMV